MPTYLDNLRRLTYISPDQDEFEDLAFKELSRSGSKKAAVTEMPQQNNPDVQDLGENALEYPVDFYFYGDDYTSEADAFFEALRQRGTAQLKHPRWGDLYVLPLTYSQSENFVEGMAVSQVSVKFIKLKDWVHGFTGFPISIVGDVASLIRDIEIEVKQYSAVIKDIFSGATLANIERSKQAMSASLTSIRKHLIPIAADDATIAEKLEKSIANLERNLDTIIDEPLDLLQTFIDICRLPARVDSLVKTKIRAYNNIYTDLSETSIASGPEGSMVAMILSGVLVGAAESTTEGTIKTRVDVADALTQFSTLSEGFFQSASESLQSYDSDFTLDHDTLETLYSISARAKSILQVKAFDIALEKVVILEKTTTLLNFVKEVYGNLDFLDEFIDLNEPVEEEFFILSPDRELRYFDRGA